MTGYDLPRDMLFAAGEWRRGRGELIVSVFPADGSENRVVHGASSADVAEVVDKAEEASRSAEWLGLKPHQRATYLFRISELISRDIERIAYVQSRDTGKTLRETRALAQSAAGTFRYYGSVCETLEEAITPSRGDYLTFSVHEPIGVVAAITPWNSPIASDAQKIAPALAAGNAVILKPASWSPLVSLELARIVEEAGLPRGLFSVLAGSGSVVGDALVEHRAVGRVSFTGGTAVGLGIAAKAAAKLMPVSLELGGKSPTIVFDDCDVDQALAGVLFGMFSSTGQACVAGSRLLVQRSLHQPFVERLVEATRALKVGHPFEAATQVAPLVRGPHRDAVERHVQRAVEAGASLLCGGARPTPQDRGFYYLPTILAGVANTDRIAREEVFGPVLVVMPFDDEDEAVAIANDNEYGLACGIWTRSFQRAWRVSRAIRTGTVWVNTYKQLSISTPFGGEKNSGIGREKGVQGLLAYTRQKSLYFDMSGEALPWAGLGQ